MSRRTIGRLLVAVSVLVLATVVPARPSGALPILAPDDAVELANKLAEATEEQGVCYGWVVQVVDDAGSSGGLETGSSLGPDRSPLDPTCAPAVVFVADIHYTSEFSEAPDDASFRVETTLAGFDTTDVSILGVSEGALLGENDDLTIFNATSLLPLLVAEQGLAPPVPVEETVGTIPEADRPTGGGGSDRVRTYGSLYFFAGFLVFAGIAWLVTGLVLRSVQARHPDFALSDLFDD